MYARQLERSDSKSAGWIAKNAVRELTSEKITNRIKMKEKKKNKQAKVK